MANTVEICNLGLGWLGARPITSLMDKTTQAELCRINFPLLRDAVLEARAWTFASRRATLAPTIGGKEEDNFGYGSRFTVPAGCIRILRAGSSPVFTDRLMWELEGDEIRANVGVLYIKFIKQITNTSAFSPAFTQCLAARIAADLCIPLTENRKLQVDLWKIYEKKLFEAAATDGMQGKQERIRSDALIRARLSDHSVIGPYV